MSFDLFHRAQQHPGLSQTQKGVLVALVTFADGDGWCWPSIPTLASYAGVKDRAAQSALADLLKLGLVERHHRLNDSSKFRVCWQGIAQRGCPKNTGAAKTPVQQKHQGGVFPTPGGVSLEHQGGVFPTPKDTSEDPNSKIPVKGPVGEAPPPPKPEQGVSEVKFGPSPDRASFHRQVPTAPQPDTEMVALLMGAGLNLGAASGVARKLADASVLELRDADPLDEFDVGRIVGSDRKAPTIKALRAGGWMPPKERATVQDDVPSVEELKKMRAASDARKKEAWEKKNGIRDLHQAGGQAPAASVASHGKRLGGSGGSGVDGSSDDWIPI